MNILFIGDIVGRPGRHAVARWLPGLCEQHGLDLVIANAENASGGLGVLPETLGELQKMGVHAFTLGNHTWRKEEITAHLDRVQKCGSVDAMPTVRPANFPQGVPGRGAAVVELTNGRRAGILNVIGRVFMEACDCPFQRADEELAWLREECNVVLVDIHAEASSEKVALGWHLDGRCTAVVGTHTHIQTADEWILPQGTGYITDVGMCGPYHSVIGVRRERVIEKFMTGLPRRFDLAKGPACFSAVLIEADEATGRAVRMERFLFRDED